MKSLILKYSGLAIISLMLMSIGVHDFYTSMTKVDYNMASATVQFSTKLDLEHLEMALGKKASASGFEDALKGYFVKNFNVKVNESPRPINYTNHKITGEVIWVYFNIPDVNEVKFVEISNTLLFDKYPEQQNFVNFNINGNRDSMIAKKGSSSAKKSF